MKKSSAILAAVSLTAVLGASEAVSRLLVSEALDRAEPRLMTRIRPIIKGSRYDPALLAARTEAAESLASADTERVTITACDGVRLVGHLRRAPDEKRIVLAVHGWRSSWTKDFGMMADFLHDEGCTVLYAEQRGQGESGGDLMTCGVSERFDILDWLAWITENISADLPIYLHGISMGATTVLLSAGLCLPDSVRGITADCGFSSPDAIWRHVTEANMHLSYALLKNRVAELCRRRIGVAPDSVSTIAALRNNKVPVLFVHGLSDTFVPLSMTVGNYNACTAPKRLLLTENAPHSMSFLTDPDSYKAALRDLWQGTL